MHELFVSAGLFRIRCLTWTVKHINVTWQVSRNFLYNSMPIMEINNTAVEYVVKYNIGCLTCVLYYLTKFTFQVFALFHFATFVILDFLHIMLFILWGIIRYRWNLNRANIFSACFQIGHLSRRFRQNLKRYVLYFWTLEILSTSSMFRLES